MLRSLRLPVILLAAFGSAAMAQGKPLVTNKDLAKWESLGQHRLSPDGTWLTWSVTRGDQDGALHLRGGPRDTRLTIPFGQSAAFSSDSKWFAYLVGVSTAERERLTKEKKPIRTSFVVRNLVTGDTSAIAEVSAFSFAPSGGFVSVTRYQPDEKKKVNDVLILDLAGGTRLSLANVAEQAWSDLKALLAVAITVDGGNGVQLFDGSTGSVRILESSPSIYRALAWRPKSDALAVLRTNVSKEFSDTAHTLLTWNAADGPENEPRVLDPAKAPGFPATMRIAEHRRPLWSADGRMVYLGLQPRQAVADAIKKSDTKVSDVEIWHVNDVRTIPQQRSSEQRDVRATLLAAWHQDGRVVPLGTSIQETATVLEGDRILTESDRSPYAWGQKFGRRDEDMNTVDIATGQRKKLLEKVRYGYGADPTGQRATWFDGTDWWVVDVAGGAKTNLTARVRAAQKADFIDRDDDHPSDVRSPWGSPSWSKDGKTMFAYTEYDVWALAVDGSGGTRLTNGARDGVQHRLVNLAGFTASPADRAVDRSKTVWLSLFGKKTKRSGYAQLLPNGTVNRVIFEDAQVSGLQKADITDRYAFVRQIFEDSPDVFVGSTALTDAKQWTETNAFQKDYAWGKAELIEFTSTIGRP